YMLEELYNRTISEFGVSGMDFDAAMRSIYDSMYTGTVAKTDFEAVLLAREKVAQLIELLSSDVKAFYSIGEVNALENSVDITVVAERGTVLKVGDKTYRGSAYGNADKIVYTMPLSTEDNYFDAVLVNGESEVAITFFVTNGIESLANFETAAEGNLVQVSKRLASPKDHITVSHNTDARYVKSGEGSLKLDIAAYEWTMAELANYRPYFYFDKSVLGNVKEIQTFELDVFNPGTETLAFSAELSALSDSGATRRKRILQTELAPGWNKITIIDFAKNDWVLNGEEMYSKVTSLNFYFDLLDTDITVYVDNVYITKR
ncbi:MAG: hypothetical protein ACI4ST_08105, partial [Candidatus Gallimonas sp.]